MSRAERQAQWQNVYQTKAEDGGKLFSTDSDNFTGFMRILAELLKSVATHWQARDPQASLRLHRIVRRGPE